MISKGIWAIEYSEAEEFLLEYGLSEKQSGVFIMPKLRVSISEMEKRRVGPLFLSRTEIFVSGSTDAVERFTKSFRLRFFRGGG